MKADAAQEEEEGEETRFLEYADILFEYCILYF